MIDGAALRALEFDRIVEVVRSFALTPLGAAALGTLRPHTDARAIQTALTATTEGVAYLDVNAPLPLEGPDDLGDILAALAVEARLLDARQLSGMATFLTSVGAASAAVARASGGPFPVLRALVDGCRSFEREIADIRAALDDQGEVVDDASPELRAIRDRLRKQRGRLRSMLESYLRGSATVKYLQEQIVTERNGRFVLVVRSQHRSAIPGIVHGSSGSGASLFLEPLSTVEINNDIVALEQDEAREIARILLALANALRQRGLDLRHTLTAATDLDVIQARASASVLYGGIEPRLVPEPRIELPAARHPLLIPAVRARTPALADNPLTAAAEPVAVDIRLAPPIGALVVTGPNTGGKTVTLKATGLLVLMAQAGLHVPAGQGAQLPVFRSVFADIGDEQSLKSSLSTFSGHITNIVEMDRRLALPALVLLDEVGAGTDPTEGGALAAALIERFRGRGALVVATTHDDVLKSYASTSDGVTCAGFGFDPETYAPTYRLTYGTPGRSLALEIAARLGVATDVIDDARARRSAREAQLADQLARMDAATRELEVRQAEVAEQRADITRARADLGAAQRALEEREQATRDRLAGSLDVHLRAARQEVDAIVDGLRARAAQQEAQAARRPRLSTGETGKLRREATTALHAVAVRAGASDAVADAPPSGSTTDDAPPAVGSRVVVESLRLEGKVVATHGREAEVEVRGKRLHVRCNDLRVVAAREDATGGGITVDVRSPSEPPVELNVIGCRVDEALSRVEKYVDQAIVGEQRQLRVIHGHGTGQLRRAIAGLLEHHPQVATFALASPDHGGGGVTVIELKD